MIFITNSEFTENSTRQKKNEKIEFENNYVEIKVPFTITIFKYNVTKYC